jgi:hypothetical protein
MTTFKNQTDAITYVRDCLNGLGNTKFSVGITPTNNVERMFHAAQTAFVRWNDGPSYDEVKDRIMSLNVHLSAGRGVINFVLFRNQ